LRLWKKRAEELAIQKKLELRDELTKELANKADLLALRAEMQATEAKIEKEILRLDRKFTILFIILFFTMILVNQNSLEFLLKVLGVIR
jgi:hypothetical protein